MTLYKIVPGETINAEEMAELFVANLMVNPMPMSDEVFEKLPPELQAKFECEETNNYGRALAT